MTEACYFVFSLKKLSPERYFEKNKFIDKSCARQYEKDLKREFKSWADEKHLEKVNGILRRIRGTVFVMWLQCLPLL